ncbi:UNVERIFIED_CONTAM: hypothetical protein Slati_2489200 [Sesamum latifolium]|uniref:Uncharacterized protein n=1 Tax=Sesamum latifolium TaxID=2727402 RepID=A0AAW2WEF1_9LAMI
MSAEQLMKEDWESWGACHEALIAKHLQQLVNENKSSIWVAWVLQYKLKRNIIWIIAGKEGSWGRKKLIKLRDQFINGWIIEWGLINDLYFGRTLDIWMGLYFEVS